MPFPAKISQAYFAWKQKKSFRLLPLFPLRMRDAIGLPRIFLLLLHVDVDGSGWRLDVDYLAQKQEVFEQYPLDLRAKALNVLIALLNLQ